MAAPAAAPQRVPRPLEQRAVSHKRRHLCVTPLDRLEVGEMDELLQNALGLLQQATNQGQVAVAQNLAQLSGQLIDAIEEKTTMDVEAELPKRVFRTAQEYRRMLTLQGAMQILRGHEGSFHDWFNFSLDQFNQLLAMDLLGHQPFHIEKRGTLPVTGALLLLLGRLRAGEASLSAFSDNWGIDAAFVSAFFHAVCDRFLLLHGHRIDHANMLHMYGARLPVYREGMRQIYAKGLGELAVPDLPMYFRDCCFAMDGMRVHICRPTDQQEVFYNGYVGYHNIGFIGIVAPDGMMVALTQGDAGHKNDPQMVLDNDLDFHLFAAAPPGAVAGKALADAAFGRTAWVAPLPKRNAQDYATLGPSRRAALSATRVIVEWAFGEIRMTFPYIELLLRMKVFGTRPAKVVRVAAIMRNVLRTMRGTNASTYSGIAPPSVAEYLA